MSVEYFKMNRILIILITPFLFGCKYEGNNNLNVIIPDHKSETQSTKKSETNLIFDTLIFDQNMEGELLNEKYSFGLI